MSKKAAPKTKQQEFFTALERVTKEMDISPALAAQWLERNKRNRPPAAGHVSMLARAMKAKRWRLTHHGIAFDREGNLIDGQHRLMAIIEAGVTVRMMVTFGADPDDMMVLDRNRVRTLKDALAIYNGRTHTSLRSAVIRFLAAIENDRANYKIDDQEGIAEDNRHNEAFEWFIANSRQNPWWYAPYAAALIYAYERLPNETAQFLSLCMEPVGLASGSPIVATLAMVANRGPIDRSNVSGARLSDFRKVLCALAAFAKGKKVTLVRDGDAGLKYFGALESLV